MNRYFLLILGLVLWTASPVFAQGTGQVGGGVGGGDQVIRFGNRLTVEQFGQALAALPGDASTGNAGPAPNDVPATNEILRFGSMVGVSGALLGTDLLRGVVAGGRPWQIARGEGRLTSDGSLQISVEGLILVDDQTNPVVAFRGLVSCMTADGEVANVLTGEFSAGPEGNSRIDETLVLPTSCLAPVVFVTSADGVWFAATGK